MRNNDKLIILPTKRDKKDDKLAPWLAQISIKNENLNPVDEEKEE